MEGVGSRACHATSVSSYSTSVVNNFTTIDLHNFNSSFQSFETSVHLSTGYCVQSETKTTMSIMYFNARSLMPKLDELCVLVESSEPDIVCIVETWLGDDIEDDEIAIPGYNIHRLDRNRHGGGIVMYTSENLVANVVHDLTPDLEFLPVSIRFSNRKLCVCIFYRPPSSASSIFDTLLQSLGTLDIYQFCNFVCVGNFNVNFHNPSHHLYPKLSNILQLLGLSQVVTGHTHVSPSGHTSLIDLTHVSSPQNVQECIVIPPLANSDHLGFVWHWT